MEVEVGGIPTCPGTLAGVAAEVAVVVVAAGVEVEAPLHLQQTRVSQACLEAFGHWPTTFYHVQM